MQLQTVFGRDNGIPVVRRRSGGGAVFADMQNYMFSYIAPGDAIQSTFSAYTTMIADMLCRQSACRPFFHGKVKGQRTYFVERKPKVNHYPSF